jgi:hypothetical protein
LISDPQSKPSSKLSTRGVIVSLSVAAALFAAFNICVAWLARNSVPRQLLRQIDSTRGVTDLAFGNSLMFSGFDPDAYDRALAADRVVAMNAGLGASSVVEHLEILSRALERDDSIRVAIYGFFDFQLTDPPVATVSDIFGNRAMSYYAAPAIALQFYEMTPRDRIEFRLLRHVPVWVDRGMLWAEVEKLRRAMGQVGMPAVTANQFGRASDFTLLEASSPAEFEKECRLAIDGARGLSRPVVQLIADARAHGARVVIVEMPLPPAHQQQFYSLPAWQEYRKYVADRVRDAGADYIKASDWITDPSEFQDALHMTAAGATEFSRRLATTIHPR